MWRFTFRMSILIKIIIVIILMITLIANKRIISCGQNLTERERLKMFSQNISILLDSILEGYDSSIRPGFGGPPLIVEMDIMVRSMGPVSERDMAYSMDCYFRQSWVDTRLTFSGSLKKLSLSVHMLDKIWKPDTCFYNGKQSYLHTITTPNKFLRISQDGRVLYSSRLSIKASCPMHLEKFPMDTQRCPLKLGSFGYTLNDVIYKWKLGNDKPLSTAEDMKLSQFDLQETPGSNQTMILKNGEYSMLVVYFHLQRHMGYFLIQVYAPCILIVILSWVAFWINREATADRVALGVTTVLTMAFLGLESRTDLPKVSYSTALDWFVAMCFAFVFATVIQFAIVHYFTKYGSGEVFLSDRFPEEDEQKEREMEKEIEQEELEQDKDEQEQSSNIYTADGDTTDEDRNQANGDTRIEVQIESDIDAIQPSTGCQKIINCFTACRKNKRYRDMKRQKNLEHGRINSVSKIDQASRILFPLSFGIINLFYWLLYL